MKLLWDHVRTLCASLNARIDALGVTGAALTGRVVVLESKVSHLGKGQTTTILVVGTSEDVTVTWPARAGWPTPFPDAGYAVEPGYAQGATLTVLAGQTPSTVKIRVTATALLAIGTQFEVLGTYA